MEHYIAQMIDTKKPVDTKILIASLIFAIFALFGLSAMADDVDTKIEKITSDMYRIKYIGVHREDSSKVYKQFLKRAAETTVANKASCFTVSDSRAGTFEEPLARFGTGIGEANLGTYEGTVTLQQNNSPGCIQATKILGEG